MPVLEECYARGIAFVPFFPLGSGFAPDNPVLATRGSLRHRRPPWSHARPGGPGVAARTCGQNVLLIPGTSSIGHLEENMAVANIELDSEARELLG